jgi:hypothetical protein
MSNSQQTYKQALQNMQTANMFRRQSRYIYLMTTPESTISIATELYDIAYNERVGPYDDDDFTIFKREVAIAILKYMMHSQEKRAQEIDYNHIVMEIERSFWNSEFWKNKPVSLVKKMEDEYDLGDSIAYLHLLHGYKHLKEVKKNFEMYGEIRAYNHMIKLVLNQN